MTESDCTVVGGSEIGSREVSEPIGFPSVPDMLSNLVEQIATSGAPTIDLAAENTHVKNPEYEVYGREVSLVSFADRDVILIQLAKKE